MLAACGPSTIEREEWNRSGEAEKASAQLVDSQTAPVLLVGEYRVAGIDGEAIDQSFAMTLSINESVIDLASCGGLRWNYTYSDGHLQTRKDALVSPEFLCRLPREYSLADEAISSAERVTRTPANGIELSGGGHSITLYSQ